MFRSLYARLLWRARMIHAAFSLPRIAGADDGPPAPPTPPAPSPTAPPPPEPPKTFTQDDVNRIVEDRLARDRKDRPSDDEIEELKAKAAKHDELEAQNLSDLEKAQTERDDALQRADAAVSMAHETLRKAAIVTAAAEAGADAEIVHALLATSNFKVTKDETTFEVTVDDSGTVAGAKEAVAALIELKNIAGKPTPPGPGDGGSRPPVPAKSLDEAIREAEAAGDYETAMSLKSQKLAAASA